MTKKRRPRRSAGRAGDTVPLVLDAELGIRTVTELHRQLLALRDEARVVAVDGRAVQRVDTAALQALVAFVRARQAAGLGVRWDAVSDRVRRVAGDLGLGAALALPEGEKEP